METSTQPTSEEEPVRIARWETRGNDFLELTKSEFKNPEGLTHYSYRGKGCGGGLFASSDQDAIERMEAPWGDPRGTGQATVLRSDRPSLKRVL